MTITRVSSSLLAAAIFVGVHAGCKHHEDPPPQSLPDVSPAEMKAKADRMIRDGRRLREQGIDLRAQGKDGDDLIRQGEQMMADGQRLRDRAMMMQTP
jgi:hypothetical protein